MNPKSCGCEPTTSCDCGESQPPLAPLSVVNSAGASEIACRVGNHASLMESLTRRLSSRDFPKLALLAARGLNDPSIALLDAWAVTGDVLTFYTERYANESYLRTAREYTSVAHLAKLIGYQPSPGVASNVFLAFTLERAPDQVTDETVIPMGTAAQSIPGDGETQQTFETSDDLIGRPEWNAIRPRRAIPQRVTEDNLNSLERIFVRGVDHQIKPGQRIMVHVNDVAEPTFLNVLGITVDAENDRTELTLAESVFSIRRIFRQLHPDASKLLAAAELLTDLPDFDWLRDNVVKPLQVLINGDPTVASPAMRNWSSLSQYDDRLTQWLDDTGESAAKKAVDELSDATRPMSLLPLTLGGLINTHCRTLVETAAKATDELLALDDLAQDYFKAVKDVTITDPPTVTVPGEVTAAKTLVDALAAPAATILTEHKIKIETLVTKFNALAASPTPSVPQQTEFVEARTGLKAWWGLTDSGNLNARSTSINDAFDTLNTALTGATEPFTAAVTAIATAAETVAAITPITSGPDPARISGLASQLSGPLNQYSTQVASALNPGTLGSQTLGKLKEFLLKPILDATTPVDRHEQLIETNNRNLADLLVVSRSLAKWMVLQKTEVQARRRLFADNAKEIQFAYDDLKSNPNTQVKDIWGEINRVLRTARIVDTSNPNELVTPLKQTMESLDKASPPGLIQRLESLGEIGDLVTERKVAGLLRELNAFVGRNGGGRLDNSPGTVQGGGIGQAVQSGAAGTATTARLVRAANEVLSIPDNTAADVVAQLAASFGLITNEELKSKWQSVTNGEQSAFAHTLSEPTQLFGHNAPKPVFDKDLEIPATPPADWALEAVDHDEGFVFVSKEFPLLRTPTHILLRLDNGREDRHRITDSTIVARSDYGLSLKATRCTLDPPTDWRPTVSASGTADIKILRSTLAIVPEKHLTLSEIPLQASIGKDAQPPPSELVPDYTAETNQIELDGIFLGFRAGQYVIIEGERQDYRGVVSREINRIKYVQHKLRELPGDQVHTRIFLNSDLQHTYVRETVTIYANVVGATHGETVPQILGTGDASTPFQQMQLTRRPLTHLSAPTAGGVENTLSVRVNQLQWRETTSLLDSGPADRAYTVDVDEIGMGHVRFGDGSNGARLPTGQNNVHAKYRIGLGTEGNVSAGAISQLLNRPLGVKEVTNPLPASGGADRDSADRVRSFAPLAVQSLDRLVSVNDFSDFARQFAGVDKAIARDVMIHGQPTVHVTIAGAKDVAITPDSELFRNLRLAFQNLGDPLLAVDLAVRELLLIFLSAKVQLQPGYLWQDVEPKIRDSLYQSLSFDRRNLGQDVFLSEVFSAMQSVRGVQYVDVEVFGTLSQREFESALQSSAGSGSSDKPLDRVFQSLRTPKEIPDHRAVVRSVRIEGGEILPAQLAYLSPQVPDSLFLAEIAR